VSATASRRGWDSSRLFVVLGIFRSYVPPPTTSSNDVGRAVVGANRTAAVRGEPRRTQRYRRPAWRVVGCFVLSVACSSEPHVRSGPSGEAEAQLQVERWLGPFPAECRAGSIAACAKFGVQAERLWAHGLVTATGTENEIARLLARVEISRARELAETRCSSGDEVGCRIHEGFGKIQWDRYIVKGWGNIFASALTDDKLTEARALCRSRSDWFACADAVRHEEFLGTDEQLQELRAVWREMSVDACETTGEACGTAGSLVSDVSERCRLYQRGCESGQLDSCALLGTCFQAGGAESPADLSRAKELYSMACHAPIEFQYSFNAYGCYWLGLLASDPFEQLYFLRAACARGIGPSCHALAERLEAGSRELAFELYGAACAAGFRGGCLEVECRLERETRTAPDWYPDRHFEQPCVDLSQWKPPRLIR